MFEVSYPGNGAIAPPVTFEEKRRRDSAARGCRREVFALGAPITVDLNPGLKEGSLEAGTFLAAGHTTPK